MEQPVGPKAQLLEARHYTLWELIKLYWKSQERMSAYLSVAFIMLMTITLVAFDVVFNYWYNYFYNALQAYDLRATIRLLGLFFILAFFHIIVAVYRFYVSQMFSWRWRRWLTDQFVGRWLQNRSYYYLENFNEKTDNPEQRIQEDVGTLATNSVDLATGLVGSITTFFAFIYILWTLSGVLHVHIGSLGVMYIPGYLVWVVLIYAFAGTYYTFRIGRPLVGLNFEQQRREATFRFAAMDLRSHAEDVALYRGEHHQQNILTRLFRSALANWREIILRQKLLLWYTAGYNQLSVVLPLVVALPNYFEKIFLLGGLIQSLKAFNSVQDALSFIINSFNQIAQWRAIGQRLTTFANHMTDTEKKVANENQLTISEQAKNSISAKNITVNNPRKEILLTNINEEFIHGQHYLLKGMSGIGKSTFVRALAGIWPYASGEVVLPKKNNVMYLPQKPYMPIGTLAEAILFPDKEHPELEQELTQILRDCKLENFIPRLHETATWSEQLSPGEQQRISFARILLHKPDWVFLDESSSMLDLKNEEFLYRMLKTRLPNCSIISIGHRPSIDVHHEHIINMEKYSIHPQAIA